jgi:hypothetical protein
VLVPEQWRDAFQLEGAPASGENTTIGKMFRDMYYNRLLPDDDTWQPVKPLGNGSYGAASLFKRVGENGQDDDVSHDNYTCFQNANSSSM